MRLRLKESAQPISKLDYNIQNVVLPTLAEYGFTFDSKPAKLNQFEYVYTGYSKMYNTYTKLDMVTSNNEMNSFNEEGNDFTADLYMYLYLGIDEVARGPISSRSSATIKDLLDTADFDAEVDNAMPRSEEKKQSDRLYAPKSDTKEYTAMTKQEWEKELQRLLDEVNKANAEVDRDLPSGSRKGNIENGEDPNADYVDGAWVDYWQRKEEDPTYELPSQIKAREALDKYRYFISQIYPL